MLLARKAAPDMSAALSSGGECWRGGGSGDEDLEAVPGNESYWIYEKWDEGMQVRRMVNLNVQVLVIFPSSVYKDYNPLLSVFESFILATLLWHISYCHLPIFLPDFYVHSLSET